MEFFFDNLILLASTIGLMGWLINVILKMNSVRTKSLTNKIDFSYREYFDLEKWAFVGNFLAYVTTIFFVPSLMDEIHIKWVVLLLVLLSSFTGSEFMIRVLGAANKVVNNKISDKINTSNTEVK
jgi:hypothetical protein